MTTTELTRSKPAPLKHGSAPADSFSRGVTLSVVVPVYNEELNLPALFKRLYAVLDGMGRPYEVVFTNDGSADRSIDLLRAQYVARPGVTRIIDFNANYGQHMAIMAAFERVRGEVIVTLDADLQNPPEEIPKLLAAIDTGHDYVGGYRVKRQDSTFRTWASRLINTVREHTTDIEMMDHGCMLRAYRRSVIDAIVRSGATNTFIPALAYTFADRPTEVAVRHDERHAGASNYSIYKLIRLNFDLVTGFSLVSLQYFTMFAMACSAGSFVLVLVLAARRILLGPEEGGLYTLFGILLFLISVAMVGIGLIGEYVGRTYQVVRTRQRYHVREILEGESVSVLAPRIVFFGYSEVGHDYLTLLLERGDNVVALITHQDSPTEKIWFRTPAAAAHARGIPVFTPKDLNTSEWIERIAALGPDLILSAYYRHMISMKIVTLARLGAFNLHGSLLPKSRGRAPINWAVLHGESRLGMTLHRMVKRADAGAIVDQEGVEIGPRDTAEDAFRRVLPCARRILARRIDALLAGTATEIPQDGSQATYFGGRTPEHGRIVWTQTSKQIFNLIRAVTDPYPGAFTDVQHTRLMVWWAEIDSPAVRAFVRRPVASVGGLENGMAASASATSKGRMPGEILAVEPLVVATGDGAIELTKIEWRGESRPVLQVGQRL